MNPCHLAILCFHTLSHFFALAESSILLLSSDSALFGKKHGGVGERCILWGGRSTASPVTRHESRFTIRCIIPSREHPPERSRMPRPGLPHRKRNHHSRILPALPQRPRQCLHQKSNRDPLMNLDEAAVHEALHSLDSQSLVRSVSASDSRVTKYEHRLQEAFNFYRHEVAILCVLLLRGPQTPGELRTRAERMHTFDDLSA